MPIITWLFRSPNEKREREKREREGERERETIVCLMVLQTGFTVLMYQPSNDIFERKNPSLVKTVINRHIVLNGGYMTTPVEI